MTEANVSERTTSLHALNTLGQAVWLDSITRDWLHDGELQRMIDELGVVGVTSNPTIFAGALANSASYDSDIARFVADGLDDRTIFEKLEVEDLQGACDALTSVYESTKGLDGMVSIELEPDLANDTAASIARARHLWNEVNRPNILIKVPATDAGLPVIEELLYEGINVNVTLLFSVDVYRQVMKRYLTALERRQIDGKPLDVASVASFFVSRVDTAVDKLLDENGSDEALALRGKAAVANAVAAWAAYEEVFGSERFAPLRAGGARPQRPLWASTGTKNPSYSDILYIQDLIVAGTVNTMPLSTMQAFADHGEARTTITDTASAFELLDQLKNLGIDMDAVTEKLRVDGVQAFIDSFEELLAGIAAKR